MIFTDVTDNLSLPTINDDSMGASWADYDRDGWLDVYVCNYFTENWLLRNRGDGSFENVGDAMGVSNSNLPTYMCTWVDYDKDCLLDLFVGNDLSYPSEMYRNTGNGFVAVGSQIGLDLTIEAMGLSWTDYDNDLDLDLYITNVASGNRLMRNDNGVFSDVAFAAGVPVQALSWGCIWMDIDNDAYDDLHVVTQAPLVNQNINFLYKQQPNNTFINISMPSDIGNAFASAKGDLNNDGYWDFCDSFVLPARFLVWSNNGGDNHWVKLNLVGTEGNSEAIGAKINYWHGGQQHYTHTFCGESFFGQDSRYEILSLGTSTVVDSLQVDWPSGRRDIFYNLAIDQVHTLTEGSASALTIASSKNFLCNGGDAITLSVPNAYAFEWSNGSVEPTLVVTSPGTYWVRVESGCAYSDSLSIIMDELAAPEVTDIVQHPSCAGYADGCAGVLLDGQEPVALLWTEPLANAAPCALPEGIYHFNALDSNGCSTTGAIELLAPDPVMVSSLPAIICGGATTQAQLNATGGSGSYTFAVEGADITALLPGDYVGVATDENGCVGSINFAVLSYPAVNFTAIADSICVGGISSLQYFGSGGALPYTYDWQGQNPNALPAGLYTFTLTDANGCSDEVSIEVAEFPLLIAQISSFINANNGANGSMELSISGGQAPYDILWSNGETDEVIDSLGQGTYSVTVTDHNGCVSSDNQSIIDLDVAEGLTRIAAYPNPFKSWLIIESSQPGRCYVQDALGRMVIQITLSGGKNYIETSFWSTGVYILKLESDVSTSVIRVTKD